jgi:hypothetical protein
MESRGDPATAVGQRGGLVLAWTNFTSNEMKTGLAIRAPGWHTARYPTSGPSSTRSLADVLPVVSDTTKVALRHFE